MESNIVSLENTSPIHPGKYIKDNILGKTGMTQASLGEVLGVSRQTISLLVSGSINLSPAMALRLSNNIGQSVDFWLNLQSEYDRSLKPSAEKDDISKFKHQVEKVWETLGARTLVDNEIEMGIKAGIFVIENFSEDSVQPASYDLRVGQEAILSSEKDNHRVNMKENNLILAPKTTAVIQSQESLRFPKFILGRLGAMTALTSFGIVTLYGIHIDPGFEGHIYVTLHNIGNSEFSLEYLQPFVSVEFCYLSIQPNNPYVGKNIRRDDFLESEFQAVGSGDKTIQGREVGYTEEQLEAAKNLLEKLKEK